MIIFTPKHIQTRELIDSIENVQDWLATMWEDNEMYMPAGSEEWDTIMASCMELDMLKNEILRFKYQRIFSLN